MRRIGWSAVVLLICVAGTSAQDRWQPVGLGGSGGMFSLAISPADPQRMIVNCDMSGAYLSRDGGRNWEMIHHRMLTSNTRCSPVFHPSDANRVYAVSGDSNELRASGDGGVNWRPLSNQSPCKHTVRLLHVTPGRPEGLFAGTEDGAYVTQDGGASWRRCEGIEGAVVGIVTGPSQVFIATREGVFRSSRPDRGYTRCGTGLPKGAVTSFSGGSKGQGARLYATVECAVVEGRLTGGVYVSEDGGGIWRSCMGGGLNVQTRRKDEWANGDIPQYRFIATTDKDPLRVYVYCTGTSYWPPNHSTLYRSDDGGKTWAAVLFSDPRFARLGLYNVEDDYVSRQWGQREQAPPYSLAISPGNPDVVAMCCSAWLLRTDDGGRKWRVCHTGPAAGGDASGQAWRCNGLVVTTTWNYYIDPHEPTRHYLCYTDIGFARSLDAGKTWIWQGTKLPWRNTVYELALDPDVPGRIWGAMSNTHDIPNDNVIGGRHRVIMQGGIATGDDFGVSWRKADLPAAPALAVVLDPSSPKDRRTLYASLFEKGVYKSVDGGKTWTEANRGLGHPTNMRCCKLSRGADGTLFVLITGKKTGRQYTLDGVGLYRSTDAGGTWSKISGPLALHWPKDFTVKPDEPKTILLSAAGIRGSAEEGGLYRTTDGGQTWTKLVQKEREHFGAFYHPKHPGWIYMTLTEGARTSGLYLSKDDGATWQPFSTLPFVNIQRVAFDPSRPEEIILTTFGSSVLRGPAEP